MKRESIKTAALGLAAGVILMQFHQEYTNAGPQPPAPRVVPVVQSSFVPPSKMVAIPVTLHASDIEGVTQPDIQLEPGEVFVLTTVTGLVTYSTSSSEGGLRAIRRGAPNGTTVAMCKSGTGTDENPSSSRTGSTALFHTSYAAGIRFDRTPNGKAGLFLVGATVIPLSGRVIRPADLPDVTLHGYITNDY